MILSIPIEDTNAQTMRVALGGQSCRIDVRQRATGLFLDLYVNDAPTIVGVACRDRCRIVRSGYLGFIGDLIFVDQQGLEDPASPGLGTRFALCYLDASEVTA